MSFTITGGSIQSKAVKLTTTAATDLLAPDKRTVILSILASEITGATPALTLELYDTQSAVSYFLRAQKPTTARELVVLESPFVLLGGWKLRATASTANQIDVLVNYLAPDATALGTFTPLSQR